MKRAREQEREREMIEGMDGTVGKAEKGAKTETQRKTVLRITRGRKIPGLG